MVIEGGGFGYVVRGWDEGRFWWGRCDVSTRVVGVGVESCGPRFGVVVISRMTSARRRSAWFMQTLHFRTAAEFRQWLEKNHAESDGIWLRIFKKEAHEESVTYAEALDQALCYGWIDGQKKSLDKL